MRSALGATIRNAGGIKLLVGLMDTAKHVGERVMFALSLLGNLLTDIFDPEALTSLTAFAAADGLRCLVELVAAGPPINRFAGATLQNITSLDPKETCTALRRPPRRVLVLQGSACSGVCPCRASLLD